eukprot:scaffold4454_cov26-Tisochrysis_lutea.AAC.2
MEPIGALVPRKPTLHQLWGRGYPGPWHRAIEEEETGIDQEPPACGAHTDACEHVFMQSGVVPRGFGETLL